jgi:hypothetical protein
VRHCCDRGWYNGRPNGRPKGSGNGCIGLEKDVFAGPLKGSQQVFGTATVDGYAISAAVVLLSCEALAVGNVTCVPAGLVKCV